MKYGKRSYMGATLDVCVPTALPQEMRGKVVEIRNVHTAEPFRGMGQATQLLLNTMLEADINGRFLMLQVKADGPVDDYALGVWYAKLGFVPIQSEPVPLMVRRCVGAVSA